MKFKTAAQEKAERDKASAKKATKYRFEPVGLDKFSPTGANVSPGQIVVKTQPSGCPKNGTMGQTYVANLDGEFLGMVALASLTKI